MILVLLFFFKLSFKDLTGSPFQSQILCLAFKKVNSFKQPRIHAFPKTDAVISQGSLLTGSQIALSSHHLALAMPLSLKHNYPFFLSLSFFFFFQILPIFQEQILSSLFFNTVCETLMSLSFESR